MQRSDFLREFVTIPTYLIGQLPPDKFYALVDILSMADENGKVPISERSLMKRWGWGNTKVRNFISYLENQGICKAEIKHPTKQEQSTQQSTHQSAFLSINTGFFDTMQSTSQSTLQSGNKAYSKALARQGKNGDFQTKVSKAEAKQMIVNFWNELSVYGIVPISAENISYAQQQKITEIANEYGVEDILKTIQMIKNSDFLQGKSDREWKITFSWFIKIGNYEKVRGGEYDNKMNNGYKNRTAQMLEQHYAMTAEWIKEMEEMENEHKGIWNVDRCD